MGVEEAGGGMEACRGRAGPDASCAVVSNSSPVCISGDCRAVLFAVLNYECVVQLRDRSLGFSTSVLEHEHLGLHCR